MAQQGLLSRSGNTLSFGWVDKLRYQYQGNRLLSVHDGAQAASQSSPHPAGDFFDGNRLGSGLEDYAYDNNGSLTLDRNKRINLVEYNHLNLPTRIEFDNGNSYLRYRYDASGKKLQKVVKEGTAAEKTTDYLAGMVYEGNRLQFIPTAEGRILPPALADNGGSWAYEYSYKDHLGNLRLSFRPGRSYSYKATMESSEPTKGNEERMFSNLTDAIRVPNGCLGGGIKLTTTNPMGPMRILKVRRGDILTAKVKGWYSTPASSNGGSGLQLWLQAVPDGNVPGQSETRQNLPSLRVGLTLNLPNGVPANAPKAYLQLQAYDEQGQTAGQQTRFVAERNSCLSDLRIDDYRVEQDGYVRVYLASESDAPAFFDQLEINHQEALITQENHYSVFGLPLKGVEKIGSPDNKFQYNGIEKETGLGLNWNMTDFRAQDPQLGRLWQIDPIDKEDQSPYAWVINNPMLYADPLGLDTLREVVVTAPRIHTPQAGPSLSLPWWADASAGITEYHIGKTLERYNYWDNLPDKKNSVFSLKELRQRAFHQRPLVKNRPITLGRGISFGKGITLPRVRVEQIAKGLQKLGLITSAMSIVDSGWKGFNGNITSQHAGASIGVTVVAVGAGLVLGGPAALIVGAGAIIYSVYEDDIWHDYDKANATNFVEEQEQQEE